MEGLVLQKSIYRYLRRDFIFKKNFYRRSSLFKLCTIECRLSLRNVVSFETIKVLDSLSVFENLVGRKVLIIIVRNKLYNKGETIELQVFLNNLYFYNFLMYLIFIYAPESIRKLGNGGLVYFNNRVNIFSIKDKHLFNKSKFRKNVDERLNISLEILNITQEDSNYILKSLLLFLDLEKKNELI